MGILFEDVRYAGRMLRKHPGYSSIVVLTLALAIAANTVVFSFTSVLVLRPLPIDDVGRLGWIYTYDPQRGGDRGPTSVADYLDYRDSLRSFASLAAMGQSTMTMTRRGDAVRLRVNRATASLFDVWKLSAVQGRGLVEGDDQPGAPRVAVLSHRFWTRHFGPDPLVVGESLILNGQPYEIVGVLEPSIESGALSLIDVWVPLTLDRALPRDRRAFAVSGRLAQGVSLAEANAEVRELARKLERAYPATNRGLAARVASARESVSTPATPIVLALLTTIVAFVLLIACANIANLVLARGTGRRRELGIRAALGASRTRIVRQLLTESLVLALLGGALGLALAYVGVTAVKTAAYAPFFTQLAIDRHVLFFTGAIVLVAPLLFSVVPALQSSRMDPGAALKEGTARSGGSVSGRRSRSLLIVSQLTLAMALLIVSGLLIRSLLRLMSAPLGFDSEGVLSFQIELPEQRYPTDAVVLNYYDRLIAGIAVLPGVDSVAAVDRLPVLGGETMVAVSVAGQPPTSSERPLAVPVIVSDEYFRTSRIPVIAGRSFGSQDSADAAGVALVDASFAQRYCGDPRGAVGRRVTISMPGTPPLSLQIVGVVGDVTKPDYTGFSPHIYRHARQTPRRAMALMVRSADPVGLMAPVRAVVRTIDADVAVFQMRTMTDALHGQMSSTRILASMLVSFAVLALIIASAGLYAIVAYSVSQRVQEIGIRMALGAVPRDIRRLIAAETARLVAFGLLLGVAAGAAIARAAGSVLLNVSSFDPLTYAVVGLVLISTAMLAASTPLRRATRIDPCQALRTE